MLPHTINDDFKVEIEGAVEVVTIAVANPNCRERAGVLYRPDEADFTAYITLNGGGIVVTSPQFEDVCDALSWLAEQRGCLGTHLFRV